MDGPEFFLLVALAWLGGAWAYRFFRRALRLARFREARPAARFYAIVLVLCLAALWAGLTVFADDDVRSDLGLQALFVAGGLVAIAVATLGAGVLGLDAWDDGIARNNPAARIALGGLWLAVTLCSMGANIGGGNFVGSTFLPLGLALVALLGVLFVRAAVRPGFAPIASSRDPAAGWRLAGLGLAVALPLANASSGDWISLPDTLIDFLTALPILIGVTAAAVALERWFAAPSFAEARHGWAHGPLVGAGYVALGATGTWLLFR